MFLKLQVYFNNPEHTPGEELPKMRWCRSQIMDRVEEALECRLKSLHLTL